MKMVLKKKEEELWLSAIVGVFVLQCFVSIVALIVLGMQFKMLIDLLEAMFWVV